MKHSSAWDLIATELDANGSIGDATRRAEKAIAELLLTASDRHVPDALLVARVLLAAVSGAALALYEQGTPPRIGSDVEQEVVGMCGAYLAAAGRTILVSIVQTAGSYCLMDILVLPDDDPGAGQLASDQVIPPPLSV